MWRETGDAFTMTPVVPVEHFDVLIIGAGLSGIGAAYHLQTRCPGKRYAILEARGTIGGTWDLFRYPGVRSDSDMYTLGYRFRPWTEGKAIADGPSILRYIRDTAARYDIERHVRFGTRMTRATWSSSDAQWTVEAESADTGTPTGTAVFTCNMLYTCTGYYDYACGYMPSYPGLDQFAGRVIHPQQWPEGYAYDDERIVVIGSGATAVTLVPAMAARAKHVTMLQRSPTYIVSRPSVDGIAQTLRRMLPEGVAYAAVRWKNILLSTFWYRVSRRYPHFMKRVLVSRARVEAGNDSSVPSATDGGINADMNGGIARVGDSGSSAHFTPRYNPWDERVCLAPDGDFFRVLRDRSASIVTDEIVSFTRTGVQLASGAHLEADTIISATGLQLRLLSGVELVVDGATVNLADTLAYKGMMLSDVPNLVSAFGYTNASWTLKTDLTADYACRLLQYMDRHGFRQCTPRRTDPSVTELPVLDFTSGYVRRALAHLPKQGSKIPWRVHQNYLRDLAMLRHGAIDDGVMEFLGNQRSL
jgi:monooxygenase